MDKEIAIHSSIPAWRVPQMKEPGAKFMGSQRVRHD